MPKLLQEEWVSPGPPGARFVADQPLLTPPARLFARLPAALPAVPAFVVAPFRYLRRAARCGVLYRCTYVARVSERCAV